ncbi:hypothetical protein HanPSC8_Chr03g0088081 [Helianthus annuus]|nr:hypothetical protein HanPSC8_Chr03g0088081 [Helianthus annuus]
MGSNLSWVLVLFTISFNYDVVADQIFPTHSGTFGCRKTVKLNEEPNTIKIHASALCIVINFKRRI